MTNKKGRKPLQAELIEIAVFLDQYKKWYHANKETIATLDEGSNPTQPPPPPTPGDEDGE